MNSTISKPSANKSSAKTPTPTSASETDSLRRRLQEAAVRQHRLAVEQRTERELQRRQAEWSAQVVQYMAAERRLQRLRQLAVQQVRSDNSLLLLAAAKLEVQRCTVGAREAVKLLAELSGTNIGGASIEKILSDTDRLTHLATVLSQLLEDGQHIDQGAVVREFGKTISSMVQKLDGAAANVKFLSKKSVRVASDVLFAKMIMDASDEADDQADDADGNASLDGSDVANDLENIAPA